MDFSIDTISSFITLYSFRIVSAIVIFYVGKKVASIVTSVIVKMMAKSKVDVTLSKFLENIVYGLLIVVVVLTALNTLGVNTTSFVAVLAAAGFAIGLAFKDTVANIGAGVLLVFFRPFKVGDFIQAAGESGIVEEINLFSVIMKTVDNKEIIIPNSSIIGGNITNFSAKTTRRVDFVFGIGYDDDLKLAKATLQEIIDSDERVLKEPATFVAVSELADSSVNFVVRAWVNSSDYWGVYFDTIEKVKLTFDEKNISIPYPQMDIHSKN
ncbi:mechanosensitive ion channel family protein [Sulfurospirillum arcachonense]|uniref:mechanosensitive ion channel family protein n=1 Tax=Sulfurospirillum arcachonense TaxID=57666 RepID=UPI000469EBAF|nr:mechanosensitive ion channel domain-containing protein [Sulfurospirillum arcachonense]